MVDRWLFAPVDARVLAVFRVALAVTLGVALTTPEPWVRTFSSSALVTMHHALVVGALVTFVVGWRPRLIGLLLAALVAPLTPGRESLHVLLVALAATSLLGDDARKAWWQARPAAAPIVPGPMWPVRLVQVHLSAVYLVNAVAKSTPGYLSGNVLAGFAVVLPNFVARVQDGSLHVGVVSVPLGVAAVASAVAEYVLAFGFWIPRLRRVTAIFGVVFHMILKAIIRIWMLDWACMVLYLAFLLPFDRVASDARPRARR